MPLRRRLPDAVLLGRDVALGRGVVFDVAPGGRAILGDSVRLGDRVRLHVGRGATVEVGADTRIGERSALTAHERIVVGAGCVLGAEVVLLDFDHVVEDVELPVRVQGLTTAPVVLGAGVMLDTAAVVLRGVRIGDRARVGLRSVVAADVPAGAHVEGVPARPLGTPPPSVPRSRRLVRRA